MGNTNQAKKRALGPQEADGTKHGHSVHQSVHSRGQFKGLPGSRTIPPGQFQWARGSLHGENYRKSQAVGAAILTWPSWKTNLAEGGL